MGFVTGSVDALECVLRKIGIADSRVQAIPAARGACASTWATATVAPRAPPVAVFASMPTEDSLWGTQAAIDAYDMISSRARARQYDKTTAAQQVVIDYANAGGRIFTTHYGYVWLFNDAPFSSTANVAGRSDPQRSPPTPRRRTINQLPQRAWLAQWLKAPLPDQHAGADPDPDPAPRLQRGRRALAGVGRASPMRPTPPGSRCTTRSTRRSASAPANQCGKRALQRLPRGGRDHVRPRPSRPSAPGRDDAAGEDARVHDIFDLGRLRHATRLHPQTCAWTRRRRAAPSGDGCGNIIQCGTCQGGRRVAAAAPPVSAAPGGTCTPKTCAQLGLNCGSDPRTAAAR